MKKEENEGPSTGIVEKDIRDFAKNVETCLNSFAYEVGTFSLKFILRFA